jgi:group II intron reverse transcriptase/maturase
MRNAETILNIIRERGQRGLPLKGLFRLLYQRDLYLCAYAKLYRNAGAMTRGITPETVDGMSLAKIDAIVEALRFERYRWTPVRRTYIPKKNGKLRPLGMPTWSDKLLQEVIRSLLDAYYEPQFCPHSHGFRPRRGCHTALQWICRNGTGTKWFIEGDISACFDRIDHSVLLKILGEKIHDSRFLRLMGGLLDAGYLEEWRFNATYSGVPQGGVVSPILSNLVLDKLDRFVERQLIPANTRGQRRKTNPPYVRLTVAAARARKRGDLEKAWELIKQAQAIPSREPNDQNFRRLWYVRYADDFLLGFTGPKEDAVSIKQQIAAFLCDELKLELSDEKTLITHAREETAKFLGYEVHVYHADDQHDHRGQRCLNGGIGLRVPKRVIEARCAKFTRDGKPAHLPERLNDQPFGIVSVYQAEYRGLVQYYGLAYNLRALGKVKWAAQCSLVKTLANKLRCSSREVYRRFQARLPTLEGTYKVLMVTIERGADKKPLRAYFGGISLRRNEFAAIGETETVVWSGRSEITQRLLAQKCELCGSEEEIQVHHVRKLADLKGASRWEKVMAARRRKTLVVCHQCHRRIHAGCYDGPALAHNDHWRAGCAERCTSGSEERSWKSA